MTENNESNLLATPGRGIPASVLLKLTPAVRAHEEQFGSRKNRDLLRDDPEFSPWIGRTVGKNGETGDKRLDRLFSAAKAERAAKTERSDRARTASARNGEARHVGNGCAHPDDGLPDRALSLGLKDIVRFAGRGLRQLEVSMAALVGEDGCIEDIDAWTKLSREQRAICETVTKLAERLQVQQSSGAFIDTVWASLRQHLVDQPERLRAIANELNSFALQHAGLSLTSGASR